MLHFNNLYELFTLWHKKQIGEISCTGKVTQLPAWGTPPWLSSPATQNTSGFGNYRKFSYDNMDDCYNTDDLGTNCCNAMLSVKQNWATLARQKPTSRFQPEYTKHNSNSMICATSDQFMTGIRIWYKLTNSRKPWVVCRRQSWTRSRKGWSRRKFRQPSMQSRLRMASSQCLVVLMMRTKMVEKRWRSSDCLDFQGTQSSQAFTRASQ